MHLIFEDRDKKKYGLFIFPLQEEKHEYYNIEICTFAKRNMHT